MNQIFDEVRVALHVIWHNRWLALAVTWGVCLLGWLAITFIPNAYESETRIFVQLDDALTQQIGLGRDDGAREIDAIRQRLTSATNLEKVIRNTALGENIDSPREMEAAVEALAKNIKVKSEAEQQNLFEITARSGDGGRSDAANAALAQDIAQKMIDIFREENLTGGQTQMRESIEFLDEQLAERQRELEEAEQRRMAFEAQHPELIGGAGAVTARLDQTRAEQRSVSADLSASEIALASLNSQIASTPQTLPGNAAGGGTGPEAAYQQAQSNLASLRARGLTSSHPDIIAAERQVELMRPQAEASRSTGVGRVPNPAYSSLVAMRAERQAAVQSLQARHAALATEIAQIIASQAQEPGVAAEATRISRDYEVLREQYDELLQDREQLALRGQVTTERNAMQFDVIDPPTVPRVPAAPNRPLLLAGVLIVGMMIGAGVAFMKAQIAAGFATANSLERALDLPVLGTVSVSLTDMQKALQRKRSRQFSLASAGLAVAFVLLMSLEFIQRGMIA